MKIIKNNSNNNLMIIKLFSISLISINFSCKEKITIHENKIYYFNDKQIKKMIVGNVLKDDQNSTYNEGTSFYEGGTVYILNHSGQNVSKYTIDNGKLCFKDFDEVCSKFYIRDGKIIREYVGPKLFYSVETNISPISGREQ